MKFNLKASSYENGYRSTVAPRLMLPSWFRYQVRRSRVAYMAAYRREASKKRLLRCALELAWLTIRWWCIPFHYFRYGLYRTEHGLRDVLSYLPETVFYYRLLPKLNRDVVLLDDKLVSKRVLGDASAPQARLLLSGDKGGCVDATGTVAPIGSASAIARALGDTDFVVVKPARYSSGGDGVTVLIHKSGGLRSEDGTMFSLAEYASVWGPWLLEEFVTQHKELGDLNENSLNTFRVITTRAPRCGARVEYCILKLGVSAGPVDNAHDGGLYVGVDKKSGELFEVAYDESFTRHTRHPVSGIKFKGYRVSMIREVVELAERCAGLFPQIPLIGWDIAVSETGPVVIEGNSSPGLTNVQRTHGGVAPTLGRYLKRLRDAS